VGETMVDRLIPSGGNGVKMSRHIDAEPSALGRKGLRIPISPARDTRFWHVASIGPISLTLLPRGRGRHLQLRSAISHLN